MNDKTLKLPLFLACFSACALSAEIVITRIFSVIFWYHFGFLVLSTTMLGFGAGGIMVWKYRDVLKQKNPDYWTGLGALFSGLSLFASFLIMTHNPFHITTPGQTANTIILSMSVEFIVTTFSLTIPFGFMGAVILFILQTNSRRTPLLYASNLTGSGLGCLLSIILMNHGGAVHALVIICGLIILCSAVCLFTTSHRLWAVSLLSLILIFSTLFVTGSMFPIRSPQGKPAALVKQQQIVHSDWTSLSKVDFYQEPDSPDNEFGLWGLSPANKASLPERLGIIIDYWAYTTIIRHDDSPGYYDFMENLPMYGVYQIAAPKPNIMIIGAGGGMDIRAAILHNAKKIDAVEINPSIFNAMTHEFDPYSGHVYTDKRVNAHLSEGRRFLESTQDRYDIVQLSGVDTGSATQAGAYALTENFLYTREAFRQYCDHLNPGGILTMTHWYIPTNNGYPRFSMRLFCLAMTALQDRGIKEPEKNILLFQSKRFAVLLVKLTPFSPDDIRTMTDLAEKKKYEFLYRPDKIIFSAIKFYSYVNAENKKNWLSEYPFNVSAPTDNSPFYFENRKLSTIFESGDVVSGYTRFDGQTVLVILLIELLIVSFGLLIYSMRSDKTGKDFSGWGYFFSIGMGFMLAEVSLSQQLVLFLGHPVYALSVVLFSILVFSGFGSAYSERILSRFQMKNPEQYILILIALLLFIMGYSGLPLFRKMIGMNSLWVRIAISVLFLAPASFFMGFAFPAGVKKLSASDKIDSLGIYWAFNSIASVSGPALAVFLAIETGFDTVMMVAAAFYMISGILIKIR